MSQRDVHLAATAIDDRTRFQLEALMFEEDFFANCENCTPTVYHATFRGPSDDITDALWSDVTGMLQNDEAFRGTLEEERLHSFVESSEDVRGASIPLPLPIQPCPAAVRKACDVHAGVRLDREAGETEEWLRSLSIASFERSRDGALWRIFTATFDEVHAGEQFFRHLSQSVPRSKKTNFKMKFEKTVRFYRRPDDAPCLPITLSPQLQDWLEGK